MPSLKSRLVGLYLKLTRKKAFSSAAELHRWIARDRQQRDHRPPAAIALRHRVEQRSIDGCPVYDIAATKRGAGHVIYFHGGAFCFEITRYHWQLIADVAERTGARVTVPIYPLAPEHDFHAMFRMAMETYRAVLGESPASEVVFMGDSAGGNMAVVLTMLAAQRRLPVPGRHVLISPSLDMTGEEAMIAAALDDPWLDVPGGMEAIRLYCAGLDVADWRISPRHGDLSVLGKTLVFSSTCDLLHSGTLGFVEGARAAGADVELFVEEGMYHVWPLIDTVEARRARDHIVAFLGQAAPVARPRDRALPRLGAPVRPHAGPTLPG